MSFDQGLPPWVRKWICFIDPQFRTHKKRSRFGRSASCLSDTHVHCVGPLVISLCALLDRACPVCSYSAGEAPSLIGVRCTGWLTTGTHTVHFWSARDLNPPSATDDLLEYLSTLGLLGRGVNTQTFCGNQTPQVGHSAGHQLRSRFQINNFYNEIKQDL